MENRIGLYIHIPFCMNKCYYCDFFSVSACETEKSAYTAALLKSIKAWGEKLGNRQVDTVYFGGGTPSLLNSEQIVEILDAINYSFRLMPNNEITLEVNPGDYEKTDFSLLSRAGVNRISIGLQSADDNELKTLGRRHISRDAEMTAKSALEAGISNISMDVIIGIPRQDRESLLKTIEYCKSCGAKHISAYILKIEEGTHFYKNSGDYTFFDEDEAADMYLFACDALNNVGYTQYEISNFAVKGFESRHNLKYWNLEDYLGIGAAAHSCVNGRRFYYGRSFDDFYENKITDDGEGGTEKEKIMMSLRLSSGLCGKYFLGKFKDKAEYYRKLDLVTAETDKIALTAKGFLLSNTIISDFCDTLE